MWYFRTFPKWFYYNFFFRHILTAAHCVDQGEDLRVEAKDVEVWYGHSDTEKAMRIGVSRYIVHPKWVDKASITNTYDAVILTLDKTLQFSEVYLNSII